jgi:hypothetical protein
MSWFKGLIPSILPGALPCTAAFGQVTIIKSGDDTCFDQTIATLVNHVDPGMQKFPVALGQSAVAAIKGLNVSALEMNFASEHNLHSGLDGLGQ